MNYALMVIPYNYSVCVYRVPFIRKVMLLSLGEKSRSLASAKDSKTDEQSIFSEIHTIHAFGTP